MRCSHCGGKTVVRQSYSTADGSKRTQRRVCLDCHATFTAVTVMLEVEDYGDGAYAMLKRLEGQAEKNPPPQSVP